MRMNRSFLGQAINRMPVLPLVASIVFMTFGIGWCGVASAQVTWDTVGNGNWQDGVNWSTGTVPGLADDVIINQGGGFLITIGDAVSEINTLTSAEDLLLLQNRNLVMAMGGTTNGALTLGINSDLTTNGGTFTANGTTVLDGGNVFANGGSTMDLSIVGSYLTDTGTNSSRTFRANDASMLDLSGMTSISGGGFIRTLNVQANTGSTVDLSGFTNHVGGSIRLQSDGAGSSIDISALGTFNHTDGTSSRLIASNGGTLNAAAMTTIQGTGGNSVLVLVDGAASTLNIGSVTDMINARVELRNGGALNTSGITNFFGSDAVVGAGATMDLTGVTTYDVNGGSNSSRLFQANDASTLNLSNLTDLQGGTFIRRLVVEANSGSTVDMSSVSNYLGGSTRFVANGAGSVIDISSMTDFNITDGQQGGLLVSDGGTINANALTNVTGNSSNSALIQVDGATSTLNVAALTDVVNTRVHLTNGGSLNTSAFTTFTGSDAVVDSGLTMNMNGLTSYDVNGGGNGSRLFEANDASTLNFNNLTDLQGGTFIRRLVVEANSGSTVDMSSVSNYLGGSTRFVADGAGSLIDISSLTDFNVTDGQQGGLLVSDGGTINANAITNVTGNSANSVLISVSGATSTLNVASLTDVVDTRVQLSNGGTLNSGGFTTFTGSDAIALDGTSLDLTGVTSYDTNGGGNNNRTFTADGAGSVVDLSNVTTVAGGSFIRRLNVSALAGGLVDMSGMTDISSGAARFIADGAGSSVDVSALQNFMDDNASTVSSIDVSNSGQIQVGGTGVSVLTNVNLLANSGGQIHGDVIELISTNQLDLQDSSTLSGDGGTIVADLINTSGIVSPGASPGSLTIDGNFTQAAGGIFEVEIDGLLAFDMLTVTGNADLDGLLNVTLDAGFDLLDNMDFLVMDIGGTSTGNFAGLAQGAVVLNDNGFNLRVDYLGGDGNDVVLTTGFVVPEPGTASLLLLGMGAIAMRRRRRAC